LAVFAVSAARFWLAVEPWLLAYPVWLSNVRWL
jgi:hypothetical protein